MDVLVIGGSVFLGRAVVNEALAAGANVTVFNRGKSGPAPDGVESVVGDRTSRTDLDQLAGRPFDLVVDTCGYVPADVTRSAELLAASARHYAFVSTISVFPEWPARLDYDVRAFDGDPDATRDDVPDGLDEGAAYGWLKSGCELAVLRAFGPERCAILRAGLIVGPHDGAVGRLPWWINRVARGGEVLVPGQPGDPISYIDARDLARFALSGAAGTFETPGPARRDTRADMMAACAAATGSVASFTYVADDWLTEQGVEAWTEVPLWIPAAEGPATFLGHTAGAEDAGLRWRPLAETITDTWAWMQSLPYDWKPSPRTPGLAPAREKELLAAWHER